MTASKKRHPPKRSRQHIPTDDPHELIQKYFRHDRLLNPNADEGESASFKAKVKELSVRYGFEAIELPLSRAIFAASQKHHCWRLMRSLNCAQGFGPAAKAHRLRRLLMQAEQLMWNPMVGNRLLRRFACGAMAWK